MLTENIDNMSKLLQRLLIIMVISCTGLLPTRPVKVISESGRL